MNKRWVIYERIERQTVDALNAEISNYYGMKRPQQKRREKLNEIETQIRSKITNIPAGKPLRSQFQLVKDKILTTKILLPYRGQDNRTRALVDVLCSINENEYTTLKEIFSNGKVLIEIPDKKIAGSLSRIAEYKLCTLYLSPELESRLYLYVKGVVAHELAHLLLHRDFSTKKKESLVEKEADLKAIEWGF